MGKRCGCIGKDCSCGIRAGRNITFDGSGSTTLPLFINRTGAAFLSGVGTASGAVAVNGSGTVGDPYVVTANLVAPPVADAPLRMQAASGVTPLTWQRPPGVSLVQVICIGGGAGGQSGAAGQVGRMDLGGGPGAGGGTTTAWVWLPSGVTHAIMTPGPGGAGGVWTSGSGQQAGSPGGMSLCQFMAGTTLVDQVTADGGGVGVDPLAGGVAETQGQNSYPWRTGGPPVWVYNTGAPPWPYPSGAAGGGGQGINRTVTPAGIHTGYDGTSNGLTLTAGDGGAGGNGGATGMPGSPGGDGFLYGGGGGGGGSGGPATGGDRSGGSGGRGANGLVAIISM